MAKQLMHKQIKTSAKVWTGVVEKMIREHQEIEESLANPDDHDEFLAVGMALGNLENELRQLVDNGS